MRLLTILLTATLLLSPVFTDATGNAASGAGGKFPSGLLYYLGTNGTAGALLIDFDADCRALVIETGGFWPYASNVRIAFYKGNHKATINSTLSAYSVRQFDRARKFDKVILTNTTPDPVGINNDGGMTIVGAWCKR